MVSVALMDALRMLRASWRGQLVVLAAGALIVGVVHASGGVPLALRVAVSTAVLVVLVAMSARAAVRGRIATRDVPLLAPRTCTQGALAAAPIALVWWIGMAAASLHPLLGLVSLPVAMICSVVLLGPLLLVPAAVASGDPAWIPQSSFAVLRRSWRPILLGLPVVLVMVSMAALPLMLVGIVLASQLGPLAFLGLGLSIASIIPWLGVVSVAAWRVLGGADIVAHMQGTDDEWMPTHPAATSAPQVGPPEPVWVDGAAWEMSVDAGAAWGTWLRMPAASQVALRITWGDGAAPTLSLADQAGTWRRPGDPSSSGDAVAMSLPAGDTYLQVQSRSPAAQAMSITLLLPATMAA